MHDRVVISFYHTSQARTMPSQDSLIGMGPKVDGHYKMSTKRFRTYYLLNQLLQNNFLEKNFEERSEKYYLTQI